MFSNETGRQQSELESERNTELAEIRSNLQAIQAQINLVMERSSRNDLFSEDQLY